jgi:hypothetical protein
MLQEGTAAEHIHFSEINPLPVELNDLLKSSGFDHSHHRISAFGARHQRPLASMHELRLPEAHPLSEHVDFLLLSCLCWHDERDVASDDQVERLGDLSPRVHCCSLVVELELQVLIDVAQQLAVLDGIVEQLAEDIERLQALLEDLPSEVELHESAGAVGRALGGRLGLAPAGGRLLHQLEAAQVQVRQQSLPLHYIYLE